MSDLIKLLGASNIRMDVDGASSEEIAAAIGMSASWVRDQLKALHRDGLLIVGRKPGTDIAGRRVSIPAYRIRPGDDRLNRKDAGTGRVKRR